VLTQYHISVAKIIFGGQGLTAKNKTLFSAVTDTATENNILFSAVKIWPPKIRLLKWLSGSSLLSVSLATVTLL
jgi:hypothetical protein